VPINEPGVFVGIDVSKVQLDVALRPTDDCWPVSHDERGIVTLVERLQAIQPALIVVEATGGLEVPLEHRLARSDADLAAAIVASPLWRVNDEMLPSTPGVGPVLSRTSVAEVPAWGVLNRQEVAALTGMAPFNRDSDTLRGKRSIWSGRAHVRAVL
jgi:hypothetical protein